MSAPLATYYDVLQVERDASPEHIRRARRRMAQKYHPDKLPGHPGAQRAMAAINEAYEVLSDPDQRAAHDLWIARAGAARPQRARPGPQNFWAFAHPANGWPWYLLFATIAFALGTLGTAIYLSAKPARTPLHALAAAAVASEPATQNSDAPGALWHTAAARPATR